MPKLKCGCRPGKILCDTAEILWKLHSALYHAGCPTLAAYYRHHYDRHYDNPDITYEDIANGAEGMGDHV